MIGKYVDTEAMSKEEALDYIMHRCDDCQIRVYCNGNDAQHCNNKVDHLVAKYGKN